MIWINTSDGVVIISLLLRLFGRLSAEPPVMSGKIASALRTSI